MNWFKHLNIASKLAAAFLIVIGMSAAVGALEITRLSSIDREIEALTDSASSRPALATIDREVEQTRLWIAVLLGVAVIASGAVAIGVTRSLSAPIRELTTAFQAMARGELDVEIRHH